MKSRKIEKLFSLEGRVAVVTGGSRGLGREMVLAFAERGADVVIASRKIEACRELAQEVAETTGRRAFPIACHVGHWAQCEELYKATYEEFGRADVLVNNAGLSPLYESVDTITEELYDKVLAINLKGPFRLSALFGTRMAKEQGGSIINVSSSAAVAPSDREITYGAAKAGLNNLTNGLARVFAPKVRVNTIMPGPFGTDISKAWSPEIIQMFERVVPMSRIGKPEEIIGAALYLASDASSFTTGSVIKVDGGAAFAAG